MRKGEAGRVVMGWSSRCWEDTSREGDTAPAPEGDPAVGPVCSR